MKVSFIKPLTLKQKSIRNMTPSVSLPLSRFISTRDEGKIKKNFSPPKHDFLNLRYMFDCPRDCIRLDRLDRQLQLLR
jgi:hypothetical protein